MDKNTLPLFEDYDPSQIPDAVTEGLRIVPKGKKALSKEQRSFNRLIKRIENLQERIRTDSAKLDSLHKTFVEIIPPVRVELAKAQLRLARQLGDSSKQFKFGKNQKEKLREVIVDLCAEAFFDIVPDAETEAFYDSWSLISYQNEMDDMERGMRESLKEGLKYEFGIDIEIPAGDASFEETREFHERMQAEAERIFGEGTSKRASTPKQREREEEKNRLMEMAKRSVRALYLTLAKALHPDVATAESDKASREELMKRVTAAYKEHDLPTLLQLEAEWAAATESRNLGALADETLQFYITMLKERVAYLEQGLESISMDPRFMDVSDFAYLPEEKGQKRIHELREAFIREIAVCSKEIQVFEKPHTKQHIMAFVELYLTRLDTIDFLHQQASAFTLRKGF